MHMSATAVSTGGRKMPNGMKPTARRTGHSTAVRIASADHTRGNMRLLFIALLSCGQG